MKSIASFFVSISMAIASLFGIHSQSVTSNNAVFPVSPQTSQVISSTSSTINRISSSSSSNSAATSTTPSSRNSIRTLTVSTLPFNTTGWQTYQDNQSGIKFAYPSDWYLEHSTIPGLASIELTKDGYTLTIQACGSRCAPGEQTYAQNTTLSPSVAVSFNIDGFQSWRMIDPTPNGNGDPQLYFGFTFLRNVASSTNKSGFNNTSLYTPVSDSININGTYYSISYQPETDIASNLDHSIINQMDQIVRTITLSSARGF